MLAYDRKNAVTCYEKFLIVGGKPEIQNVVLNNNYGFFFFFFFVFAVVAEFVLTVICQALFVCGLIAPHALRVVEPWQQNVVVVWEVLGKQGYHYCS